MEVPLSDSDMMRYVKSVVLYNELANKTADEVMRMMPIALLYQEEMKKGHWTLLHRTSEGIEHFDPYGIIVDREFRELGWQQPHYLAKLLREMSEKGEVINYNQYPFQSRGEGINTCGRWCILRQQFSKWGIKKFKDVVVKMCKEAGVEPDRFVVDCFQK